MRSEAVAMVGVHGSAADGTADDSSDLDLRVYWRVKSFPDLDRRALGIPGGTRVDEYRSGDTLVQRLALGDLRVDVKHQLVARVERRLEDLLGGRTTDEEIQHEIWLQSRLTPLLGAEVVERWRKWTAIYPERLAAAMVRSHLRFSPRRDFERLAGEAGTAMCCAQVLTHTAQQILGILLGLNRVYGSSHNGRPRDQWLAQMRRKPDDLASALDDLVTRPAAQVIELRHRMIEETLALVEHHLPGIDTTRARRCYAPPSGAASAPPRLRPAGGVYAPSRPAPEAAAGSAVAWRRRVAADVAAAYAERPDVAAVLLVGSVAQGTATAHSDVDLVVYWSRSTLDSPDAVLLDHTGAEPLSYARNRWNTSAFGSYRLGGLGIDLGHSTVASLDRHVREVVELFEPDPTKQVAVSFLVLGVALHGAGFVEERKRRVAAYPAGLAEQMVREHLFLYGRAALHRLIDRGAPPLYLRQLLDGVLQNLVGILLGLNRIYGSVFDARFFDAWLSRMPLCPPQMASRIEQVCRLPPRDAVEELTGLVEEVLDLVAQHMPRVDVEATRRDFFEERRPCPAPPRVGL